MKQQQKDLNNLVRIIKMELHELEYYATEENQEDDINPGVI